MGLKRVCRNGMDFALNDDIISNICVRNLRGVEEFERAR